MKQLGFDEPCLAKYITSDLVVKGCYKDSHIIHALFEENEICEAHILVPTFSQTFRWFREKYNLQSEIEFRHCEYSFKINFQKLTDGENPPVMVWHLIDSWLGLNMNLFKTYEEAEQACLVKLIDIVKNK
jgi:hypothetical protein